MKLKDQMEELKAKMSELKPQVEAGDAEAVKSAGEYADRYNELAEQIKSADKFSSIMKSIGTSEEVVTEPAKASSLGEFALKSWEGQLVKHSGLTLSTPEFKANENTQVQTTPSAIAGALTTFDTNLVGFRKPLDIEPLFGAETISGNALTYYVEAAMDGTVGTIAEGAQKSQVHFADPTPVTVSLAKLAGFLKESDEIIEDAPWLVSNINGRLRFELELAIQNYLMTTLKATSGIGSETWAKNGTETVIADAILDAIMNIQETTGIAADAIVMTPAIYATLRKGKMTNGQYYGGGYFGEQSVPSIWGLPVVVNASAGGIIVGAFKAGASVISKGGISVDMTNANDKDFEKNLVTLRAERRLALAVRRPACFTKLAEATS